MDRLKQLLRRIDQKGYKAYKTIEGRYSFPKYTLSIDHVQGDPFAEPSKVRVIVPREKTALAEEWTNTKIRKIRCEDLLARRVHAELRQGVSRVRGSGKSGIVSIDAPNQKVLERTAVQIGSDSVTVCLSVGLPASGRRILGREAEIIFLSRFPRSSTGRCTD